MKLSATPQPRISSKRSIDVSTDIHSLCYSRVTMLTSEVEKLSDVLYQTSVELETTTQQKNEINNTKVNLASENERLNQEFYIICERLKQKTVEAEECNSRYLRTLGFKEELEQKVQLLVQELEKVNELITYKDQELCAGKSQFIAKTEELSECFQQTFHLENALKQVKEDKLKYMHEYQQKEKQLKDTIEYNNKLLIYKGQAEQLTIDIDLIRKNYTDLLEQKQQEKDTQMAQMDVLRQMRDYSIEDIENKFNNMLKEQEIKLKADYEKQARLTTVTLESEVETLKNKIITQHLQLQTQELQLSQYKQQLQFQTHQEIQGRDQAIYQLKQEYELLKRELMKAQAESNEWQDKLRNGEIILYDNQLRQQLNSIAELQRSNQELMNENQVIKKEINLISENNQLLRQQIQAQNQQNTFLSQVTQAQSNVNQSNSQRLNDQDKVRYLLKAVDQLQQQIRDRDNEIGKLSQIKMSHMQNSLLSNNKKLTQTLYYHVSDEDVTHILK